MANVGETCPACQQGVIEFKPAYTNNQGKPVSARRSCSRGKNLCPFVEWINPPKPNGAAPQGSPQQAPKPSAAQHPNAAADARLRAASAAWSAAMNWASGTGVAEPLQIEVRAQAGYMFILRAYQGQPINSSYQPTSVRQPGEDDDIPFGDTAFHPELA